MKTITCLAAMAATISVAYAAETDPRKCSSIVNVMERLACFDSIFPATSASESTTKPDEKAEAEPLKEWTIKESSSALDDSKEVFAVLTPDDVSETGVFPKKIAYLYLICRENKTRVVIATEMFMMSDSPGVTIRIDKEKAEKQTRLWGRTTDYKAVGLWSAASAIKLIKSLKNNGKLVVRIEDQNTLEATYSLGNVEGAAKRVGDFCGWK